MNIFKRYIRHFDSFIESMNVQEANTLLYWRNLVFGRFLSVLFPISALVAIPSLIMCWKGNLPLIGIAGIICFGIVAAMTFVKGIPMVVRKITLLLVLYLMGSIMVLTMGIYGPGFLYLIGISVMITMFLNNAFGFGSIVLNTLLVLFLVLGSEVNAFGFELIEPDIQSILIMVGLNFILVNIMCVLLIGHLLKGMSTTLTEDRILRKRAVESDNLKSAFLANISHEIRTPLNAILGFTQLAGEQDYTDEEKSNFLSNVEQSGEQLLKIIDGLMDISLIESGQLSINLSSFNVKDLFDECFRNITIYHRNDDVTISLSEIDDISIFSDQSKLQQVILNLLTNASKFTNTGLIKFGAIQDQQDLLITITDTGIGIPKSLRDKLFTRFSKENNPRHYQAGTGLGLAISKGIIDALHGDISYESQENTGTQFFIRIPINSGLKQSQ